MSLIREPMGLLVRKSGLRSVPGARSGGLWLMQQQVRNNVWPKNYLEPIAERKVLHELREKDELKKLAFAPIKSAPNCVSSSVFFDPVLNKFTNIVMRKGKKNLARGLVHETFAEVKRLQLTKYLKALEEGQQRPEVELNPMVVFKQALDNCKPVMITKPIKRGGATYQVPHPITPKYSTFLAMNWLVETVKERPKPRKTLFPPVLAKELVAAFYNEGKVVKRKHDVHKLCESNKAYAHYRWS